VDGLGISPLGDGLGPWGGPGLITIKGVIPIGRRTAAIILDRIPKLDDDGAWNDASDITNYSVFPIDPTQFTEQNEPFIPPGKVKATHEVTVVDAELYEPDPTQLLVTTDCTMEAGVEYELSLLYIKGAAGEDYAGPTTWTFKAVAPSKKFPVKYVLTQAQDPYYDIANGFYALDANGTPGLTGWQLTGDQNLVHHGGLANARKRINRRMFSGRGRYLIYGYGYGVDWPTGRLARPGDLRRLESAIAEQIRQEPDVLGCTVEASLGSKNTVEITARASIRLFGNTVVRQVVAIT